MAIPPDPIREVIGGVKTAVMAEVIAIPHKWKQAPLPAPKEPGMSDVPGELAKQVVTLRVGEVLFGDASVGDSIDALKPAGAYKLRVGNKGPFLLGFEEGEERPVIIGRYGPDSYRREVIEAAAKDRGPGDPAS